MDTAETFQSLDWACLGKALDETGHALIPGLLPADMCQRIAALYDDPDTAFRSTITMARHGFGDGEYKYFAYPLPDPVTALREAFYPPLAAIANRWADRLGLPAHWPADLNTLLTRCHESGQIRPTPLLLDYREGGYNCLHQDLYGDIHFPLQVVILLSDPGTDFDGGEFILVEQRPRMQSRPMVIPLTQGAACVFPVRERPRRGSRGDHRVQMRHGVSQVRRGHRRTLGLIFHDAQ